jgi:hypothetical protein
MATEPDQSRHPVQDTLLGAALLLSVAHTQPTAELMRQQLPPDRTPQSAQTHDAPHREPLTQEEKDLGHWQQLEKERQMDESFELGYALRPAEHVEERPRDSRSER